MKLFLALPFALSLWAQQTIVVIPAGPPDYMGPVNQAMQNATQAMMAGRLASIEQQRVDLERERVSFEERQAELARQQDGASYRDAHTSEATWRINQDVKDAMAACRQAHDDCEKMQGLMLVISKAIRPDWTQLTMAEYIECLYAIARNATFGAQARAMLAAAQPGPPSK